MREVAKLYSAHSGAPSRRVSCWLCCAYITFKLTHPRPLPFPHRTRQALLAAAAAAAMPLPDHAARSMTIHFIPILGPLPPALAAPTRIPTSRKPELKQKNAAPPVIGRLPLNNVKPNLNAASAKVDVNRKWQRLNRAGKRTWKRRRKGDES